MAGMAGLAGIAGIAGLAGIAGIVIFITKKSFFEGTNGVDHYMYK